MYGGKSGADEGMNNEEVSRPWREGTNEGAACLRSQPMVAHDGHGACCFNGP